MDHSKQMDYFNQHNHFMRHTNMELVSLTDQEARTRLTVTEESYNSVDVVHGGAFFTLADCAAGALVRADGRRYVTQGGTLSLLRSVTSGTVEAVATYLHRGRSTCVVSVSLYNDAGKLVASGTYSMFCFQD